MSDSQGASRFLVFITFGLALVGVALGFASFRHAETVALAVAKIDINSTAQTATRLDQQAQTITALEARVKALEAKSTAQAAALAGE